MAPADDSRVTSTDVKDAESAHEDPTERGVQALSSARHEEPTDKGLGALSPPATSTVVASSPPSKPNFSGTLVGIAPPEGMVLTAGGERARASNAHRAERLDAGAVFARDYRVVRRVSEDAAGTVYEVTRNHDERACLLRVIEREGVTEAARRRFIDDAKAAGAAGSEHVLAVFDGGTDASTGLAWVVSETFEGETLASRLEALGTGTPMRREEAWSVLDQIAQGLARSHERGVAHRDLTPACVLLGSDLDGDGYRVKLSGFGLAHLRDPRRDEGRVFASGGAPLWIAPEQAAPGDVTVTADVWTLGLLAFRILVGRSYWRVANAPEIDLSELLSEMILEPRPTASVRAAECRCPTPLPDGFDEWFARCVSRDPEGRFSSAEAAARALRSVVPGGASVPVLEYASSPSRPTIPIESRAARGPLAGSHVISADRDTVEPETLLHIPNHAVIQEVATQRGSFDEAPTMRMRQLAQHDASGSAAIAPSAHAHPSSRPLTGAQPHASASPQGQTSTRPDAMPAPAPPPPPKPPQRRWPAFLAASVMGAACLYAVHLAAPGGLPALVNRNPKAVSRTPDHVDPPPAEARPRDAVDPPSGAVFAWPTGEPRVWRGTLDSTDARLSFVLVLRVNESGAATGFFSWTIARMSGARVGEQVRENVEGTWEPTMGALDLHGVLSTNPVLLPVNGYRAHVSADGALAGDTIDAVSHLTGSLNTASGDASVTDDAPAPRPRDS